MSGFVICPLFIYYFMFVLNTKVWHRFSNQIFIFTTKLIHYNKWLNFLCHIVYIYLFYYGWQFLNISTASFLWQLNFFFFWNGEDVCGYFSSRNNRALYEQWIFKINFKMLIIIYFCFFFVAICSCKSRSNAWR